MIATTIHNNNDDNNSKNYNNDNNNNNNTNNNNYNNNNNDNHNHNIHDKNIGSNKIDKINKKQLQLDSMIIFKAMLELISTVSSLDAWSSRIFDIE